jgi:hypothetical protein
VRKRRLNFFVRASIVAATVLILVASTATPSPTPPPPNPGNGKGANGSSAAVTLSTGLQSSTVIAAGGGSESSCQWQLVGTQKGGNGYTPLGQEILGAGGGYDQNENPVATNTTGTWYLVTCPSRSPASYFIPFWQYVHVPTRAGRRWPQLVPLDSNAGVPRRVADRHHFPKNQT